MTPRLARVLAWLVTGGLVVLGSRAIAYAVAPSSLAARLSQEAGGPRLPLVAAVSLGIGLAASTAIVWLASLGVRERRLIEGRRLVAEPRLRLGLLVIRAAVLFAATSATFAVLESYLHWRAGLGWHGLHCLTGPVHRDAIPLLLALSVVAAALACAVEHVLAWMRRVWAAVNRRRRVDGSLPAVPLPARVCAVRPALVAAHGARGPPFLS